MDKKNQKDRKFVKYRRESSRNWCFTQHFPHWDEEGFEINPVLYGRLYADNLGKQKEIFKCFRFQLEFTKKEGYHFQGVFALKHDKSAIGKQAAKKICGTNTVHVEPCRDLIASWEYCNKSATKIGDEIWQMGSPGKAKQKEDGEQGKRNDLHAFVADCKLLQEKEITIKELQEKHVGIEAKYMRYFDRAILREIPDRTEKPVVLVFWGDSGTGKTTAARKYALQRYGEDEIFCPLEGNGNGVQWWDGYHQQKCVIFDDFDQKTFKLQMFKRLCDGLIYMAQMKNGYTKINSELIIFTSNYNPLNWWGMRDGSINQTAVMRRIDGVYKYTKAENESDLKTAFMRAKVDVSEGQNLLKKFM